MLVKVLAIYELLCGFTSRNGILQRGKFAEKDLLSLEVDVCPIPAICQTGNAVCTRG